MSVYDDEHANMATGEGPGKEDRPDHWMRLLYILVFGLAFYVTTMLLCVQVVAQFVFTAVSGSPNAHLLNMGTVIAKYGAEVLDYLTLGRDELPFPFSPLPQAEPRD